MLLLTYTKQIIEDLIVKNNKIEENMGYSAYLKPRKETISEEGIEGIIDLANLSSGNSNKIEG